MTKQKVVSNQFAAGDYFMQTIVFYVKKYWNFVKFTTLPTGL